MKEKSNGISKLFKPYLSVKTVYKGGKAAVATNKNPRVYKLSSNENPIGTSPLVIERIRARLKDLHLYPDNTDIRLREALVKDFNGALNINQFIAAASGSEIIDLIIRAFVREGDEIILSNPCFLPYSMFSLWAGARVVDIPLKGKNYQLNVDGILGAINKKTRIIFLTSPNNPTGSYIPRPLLEQFLDGIPNDVLVIYDEVYRHFADAGDYTEALPYVLQGRNIVAINSFSKTYGLAGMRLGYCYTTSEIANYVRQICKPFLIPTLSLEAGMAALEDKGFLKKTVDLICQERKYLSVRFQKLGIDFLPSQGNFFLVDPPVPDREFVNFLFGQGIMVRPVGTFGAPGKVRITIGDREANEALLDGIRKCLQA